jgi:GNAT superfamily N-acetyltransferase
MESTGAVEPPTLPVNTSTTESSSTSSSSSSSSSSPRKLTIADLRLRRATGADDPLVPALYDILLECGTWMWETWGLTHWHPPYPLDVMREHARDHQVYGVEVRDGSGGSGGGQLAATFTISTRNWVPYFTEGMWSNPGGRALYLGKLAVRPAFQGRGIARVLLAEVERVAREVEGCTCVRFDAVVKMPLLDPLYTSAGFRVVHEAAFPDACGTMNTLHCYEKVWGSSSIV